MLIFFQLTMYIQSILEDTQSRTEELAAHREIVRLLQKQIDVFSREKETLYVSWRTRKQIDRWKC